MDISSLIKEVVGDSIPHQPTAKLLYNDNVCRVQIMAPHLAIVHHDLRYGFDGLLTAKKSDQFEKSPAAIRRMVKHACDKNNKRRSSRPYDPLFSNYGSHMLTASSKISNDERDQISDILCAVLTPVVNVNTRFELNTVNLYFKTDADMLAFLKSCSPLVKKCIVNVQYPKSKQHEAIIRSGREIVNSSEYSVKCLTAERGYSKEDRTDILSILESFGSAVSFSKQLAVSLRSDIRRNYVGSSVIYFKDDDTRVLLTLVHPEFIKRAIYLVDEKSIKDE